MWYLTFCEMFDGGSFLSGLVAGEGNRYRICGFSALWTLLAVMPGLKGRVLDYQVWHEEATRSAVSFAAVAFSSPGGQGATSRPETRLL